MTVTGQRTVKKPPKPSLRRERELLRSGATLVAGIDEVGRGALAGPVTVGVTIVDLDTPTAPKGLNDSKLLKAATRVSLEPRVSAWAVAHGVGDASNQEIDSLGMSSALALAALRAMQQCAIAPDVILLDGHHDWLSPPEDLFSQLCGDDEFVPDDSLARLRREVLAGQPPVHTVVGGDMTCSSISAASVLAKVHRDEHMVTLAAEEPHHAYGWESNKGYGASQHLAALLQQGRCHHHRQSWDFPAARRTHDCRAASMEQSAVS